jgi:hypothetical protein
MGERLALLLNVANGCCWLLCFWWMHRISSRQNVVLEQLTSQAHRIEEISRQEHALLAEVHPNVESIQKGVSEVSEKVARVEGTVGGQEAASSQ